MEHDVRFWDKISTRYANTPIANNEMYQKKLKMTRELFTPDFELLEFGCGTGSTAIAHAPYVHHIHAIDFSAKMLKIAKDRAEEAGIDNISFQQATLETLTVLDNSKDMVLGLSVLHLLPDYIDSIHRVFQIVKPGGYFVSNTACLADHSGFLKLVLPIGQKLGLIPRVYFVRRLELEAELVKAGFTIETSMQPKKGDAVFIIARKPG